MEIKLHRPIIHFSSLDGKGNNRHLRKGDRCFTLEVQPKDVIFLSHMKTRVRYNEDREKFFLQVWVPQSRVLTGNEIRMITTGGSPVKDDFILLEGLEWKVAPFGEGVKVYFKGFGSE